MAIAEDASTPTAATGSGPAASIVSNSFSPPANSLVVVMTGFGWSLSSPNVTVGSVTDTSGATWTKAAASGSATLGGTHTANWDGGCAELWYSYFTSAPGSITVTTNFANAPTASNNGGGRLIDCRVLTGAAATQTGATSASEQGDTSATAQTVSITTTTTGSFVYCVTDASNTTSTSAQTAATGDTKINEFFSSSDAIFLDTVRTTSATGTPGATTVGISTAVKGFGVAAWEILPAAASVFIAPPPLVVQQTAFMTATY